MPDMTEVLFHTTSRIIGRLAAELADCDRDTTIRYVEFLVGEFYEDQDFQELFYQRQGELYAAALLYATEECEGPPPPF